MCFQATWAQGVMKGVGETTDIAEKEMFSFEDEGGTHVIGFSTRTVTLWTSASNH